MAKMLFQILAWIVYTRRDAAGHFWHNRCPSRAGGVTDPLADIVLVVLTS
jgi:hypothetical protein